MTRSTQLLKSTMLNILSIILDVLAATAYGGMELGAYFTKH